MIDEKKKKLSDARNLQQLLGVEKHNMILRQAKTGKHECRNIKARYSRGQKKRDTRCYSDTYHRREMKLVPFFIAKCPL